MHQLTIDEIKRLTFEERLYELAKELPSKRRLKLQEYFELFEWANLFTLLPRDGSRRSGVGYEIGGIRYGLFFTREEAANAGTERGSGYVATRVRVREILERFPHGWGVIVDYGTPGEVRISPADLIEQSERIRVKQVRQEATEAWLAELNERFVAEGIPRNDRAGEARQAWADLNGFPVLAGSRRDLRINWYFAVVAGATPDEARVRCDKYWRDQYAADPYLFNIPDEDLDERLAGIRTNLMFADREALPHELDNREWRELYEHIRFEHERRRLAFRDEIPLVERLAAWPRLDRARAAFRRYVGPDGQLFKFGSSKHIAPMVTDGVIRIFPATRYDDPSLLPSQRDDELSRSILVDSKHLRVEHTAPDGVRRPLNLTGAAKFTARFTNNYYVWFTSTTFDARLFDDFKADACLVIHNGKAFIDRLLEAMEVAIPNWPGCSLLVNYFDPIRTRDEVLTTRDKNFRYSYQREYRFLWDPPSPERVATLPPIDLKLGSLRDIASVIQL